MVRRFLGAVQLTKRCLKKVIGQARLTYIEMQTVLLEIEVVLNSRPLCELYDNDYEDPLTPNHLLFGRKVPQCNTYEGTNSKNINGKQRVRYVETLLIIFGTDGAKNIVFLCEISRERTERKIITVGKYEYRLRQFLKLGRRCIIVRGRN